MTREMNKPEYEINWRWNKVHGKCLICRKHTRPECSFCVYAEQLPKERVLNPDIAEFVNELNKRLENK